jgi:hypothetical protein
MSMGPHLKEILKQIDPTWSGRTLSLPDPVPPDEAGQATLRQALGPALRVPLDLARDLR